MELEKHAMVRKKGASKTLRYSRREVCKECNGDGHLKNEKLHELDPEPEYSECRVCRGERMVEIVTDVNIFPCIKQLNQ